MAHGIHCATALSILPSTLFSAWTHNLISTFIYTLVYQLDWPQYTGILCYVASNENGSVVAMLQWGRSEKGWRWNFCRNPRRRRRKRWCSHERLPDYVSCHQQQQPTGISGRMLPTWPSSVTDRLVSICSQETSFEMQSIYVTTRFAQLEWRACFAWHHSCVFNLTSIANSTHVTSNISYKLPATVWLQ